MDSYCHQDEWDGAYHRGWDSYRRRRKDYHREWDDCYSRCHRQEGPLLVLSSSTPRNKQKDVSPRIKSIKLVFRQPWGWCSRLDIDMWQGSNKIPIRIRESQDRCTGARTIKVVPLKPLLGGKLYKVRIKGLFTDYCGERVKETKMISFTTGC